MSEPGLTGVSALLRPDSRLTAELVADYVGSGAWTDRPLRGLLDDAVAAAPDRLAVVSVSGDRATREGLTYRELDEAVHRFAAGLRSVGVGPRVTVAVMLPNRLEFAVAIWAVAELGAVYTGIPVAYGERETRLILARSGARVVVVPDGFRGVAHRQMLRRLRPDLPGVELVVVLDGADPGPGECSWNDLVDRAGPIEPGPVDPLSVAHVGFTSGTTGEPKGVMNTHQTLLAVLRRFVEHIGAERLGEPVVNLVASPVGHHTGFLWGVLTTAHLAGTAVFLDRWDARVAAEVIRAESVTTLFGAPTFVQDLLRGADGRPLPSLRTVVVAGAPVPRGLVEALHTAHGAWLCPAWGMTEWGIGVACRPGDDPRYRSTDGVPVAGCEVRVVDDAGALCPAAISGRLQIRGPGLFVGYLERLDAMAESFTADGWFDTGDVAAIDGDGFVTLGGRTKDIIIRGGENIPVTEVESLLCDDPDIVEAAVVGIPDPRLGERALAVIVTRRAARPSLAEVVTRLTAAGLSTHFLPEAMVVVDELPKTASGKIRKTELRGLYRDVLA